MPFNAKLVDICIYIYIYFLQAVESPGKKKKKKKMEISQQACQVLYGHNEHFSSIMVIK